MDTSLGYFAEKIEIIFNEVDNLQFEVKNLKNENHSLFETKENKNIVSDRKLEKFSHKDVSNLIGVKPKSSNRSLMLVSASAVKEKARAVVECHSHRFLCENFRNLDSTKQLESLCVAFEKAQDKQCQLQKKLHSTLWNVNIYAIEAVKMAYTEYFDCVEENRVAWEKFKVMFVLPTIASWKNAGISHLSVSDSVKEVFQPHSTWVDVDPHICEEIIEQNAGSAGSANTFTKNVLTISEDNSATTLQTGDTFLEVRRVRKRISIVRQT